MKQFSIVILAAVLLGPALASAYVPSPQYGALELKFGPYQPNIDDAPGVGSPYGDTFGGANMFLTVIEVDYQFWHKWGFSLGAGFSFGFMQESTPELSESGAESAEYTVLNVMPFALLAVVRFDVLADKAGIPIVPFVKGGINWYLWWVLSGGETARSESGDKAVGATPGWQFNVGLMLRLDPLDEISARTFDNEVGVNHSYFFVEILFAGVHGLGRDGYMHLSPENFWGNATFLAGLALEF